MGFLPGFLNTRGNKFFIALATTVGMGLIWLALTDLPLEIVLAIGIIWGIILFKWG